MKDVYLVNRTIAILLCICIFVLAGCIPAEIRGNSNGVIPEQSATNTITPTATIERSREATIDAADQILNKFNTEDRLVLQRYLAGNGRWDVRGHSAIRKEIVNGRYVTTLNGFYSRDDYPKVWQTRVILSFDQPYGYPGNVTKIEVGEANVPVTTELGRPGIPGYSSYVIIKGDSLFLEIYDQAPEIERTFTQQAINEVFSELAEVLNNIDTIKITGVLPNESYYPQNHPSSAYFDVKDGFQPGIYILEAAVNPISPGVVYARVFAANSDKQLSEDTITPKSRRKVGWSEEGQTYFPYNAQITVYEGSWGSEYEARFELWHRDESGREVKLTETSRMIEGWQR